MSGDAGAGGELVTSGAGGNGGSAGKGGSGQGGVGTGGGSGAGGSSGSGVGGSGTGGSGGSSGGSGGSGGMSGTGASGGASGTGGTSGAGGTSGTGGTSGGASGKGGGGGVSGKGGSGGVSGSNHTGGGPQGGYGGVSDASDKPLVELVIDGSSSMLGSGLYDEVYKSIVTDNVLGSFEAKLDLGLSIYQGTITASTSESDPNCAIMTNVGFAGDNAGEIGQVVANVGNAYVISTKYETPTNFAVHSAVAALGAFSVPSSVKKYIVLISHAAPNTCLVHDPQCGEDAAIAAIQDARAAGIHTLAVGLLMSTDDGCPTGIARCGNQHLQDMANAGAGYPVEPPSDSYRFEPCVPGHTLQADYAATGGGGAARYYSAANSGGLTGELTAALQAIVDDTAP
jgi:hypothetical protein